MHRPVCGAATSDEGVNDEWLTAWCEACDVVSSTDARVAESPPHGVRVLVDERRGAAPFRAVGSPRLVLEIRRQASPGLGLLVVIMPILSFILVKQQLPDGEIDWSPTRLVPVLRVLVVIANLCLAYLVLCKLVNHTRIALEDGVLSIGYAPLPRFENPDIDVGRIRRIVCVRRADEDSKRGRPETYVYAVKAQLTGGAEITLLRSLGGSSVAVYLQALLEHRLGLATRAVAGATLVEPQTAQVAGAQDPISEGSPAQARGVQRS